MWIRTSLIGAGALVALAVAAGCSGNTSDHAAGSTSAPAGVSSSVAPNPQAGQQADKGAHNDADMMFAQHMIPHHQQAVELSDILLAKPGIDPRVTELATAIKAAQGPEIEQMQGWVTQWGNPPMPPMEHGEAGHGGMPAMQGMVAQADIAALRNAQGVEAAKMFLTQMIGHHEGAITMAQDEIDDGQYPDAVQLAHAIVTTQQREIDTMRGILGTL